MVDLGTDINWAGGDLDPLFGLVSGRTALIQAIVNRLSTKRGALATLEPGSNYGMDVREWLNRDIDSRDIFQLQSAIESEAEEDERVLTATANVTFDQRKNTLLVKLALEDADGPFELTIGVSELTVELLRAA